MTWYSSIPPARLRCIIQNSRCAASRAFQRGVLWGFVSQVFGVGGTSAIEICRLAELDPDERVAPLKAKRILGDGERQ